MSDRDRLERVTTFLKKTMEIETMISNADYVMRLGKKRG
jgi:hypothetical protein